MFYGDGIITPAISVLSAVKGLELVTPLVKPYVIPITLRICQSVGTHRHGATWHGPLAGKAVFFMLHNAALAPDFFRIPADDVIELHMKLEI